MIWRTGISALGFVVVGCCACGSPGGSHPAAATTAVVSNTASAPTSAAPSSTAEVTTTTAVPPDPKPTPDAASGSLIEAWEKGDRSAAALVATPAAIAELFAVPYTGQVFNDRGCGAPGPNVVQCSWGPYAGAAATDALYDLTVMPAGANWYVSAVDTAG